jgi:peptidoglycan hydrolase-like protein with peptidoglycan-binding domain
MSREKVIEIAASQKGTKEAPANSNRTKYGEWYGLNGQKWCCMFVSWVFDQAGHRLPYIDNPKGYQSCQSGFAYWRTHNQLTTNPQPGDVVLFDWNGDGICEHTGIFAGWVEQGKTFQSWEGNTAVGNDSDGGEVMLRTRNKSTVRAFVNPGVFNDAITVKDNTLKSGDVGADVTNIQRMLYYLGYSVIVDGEFGPMTENVVKAFQKDHNLEETGQVTPMLEGLLQEEVAKPRVSEKKIKTATFLHKGDSGAAVIALQQALKASGASIDVDGVFGDTTIAALKAFQKQNNLQIDGVAGPDTFKLLKMEVV